MGALWCESEKYVAVRTPKGGGAREVSLPLSATAEQVIEIGKGLFYPNGVSYYGNF